MNLANKVEWRVEVVNAGTLEVLNAAMGNHTTVEKIQHYGCWVLLNLAVPAELKVPLFLIDVITSSIVSHCMTVYFGCGTC